MKEIEIVMLLEIEMRRFESLDLRLILSADLYNNNVVRIIGISDQAYECIDEMDAEERKYIHRIDDSQEYMDEEMDEDFEDDI